MDYYKNNIFLVTANIKQYFNLYAGFKLGMRIEGAMQYMTYEKMLRLRNGGDKVLSQAITFCTNDQERIFECVAGGVLAFGTLLTSL